jgi:uncharacterized protein GlcG (DUF336 family)
MKIPAGIALTFSLTLAAIQVPAADDELITQKVLPLKLETEAALAVIQACAAKNFHVSVVIVDAYGNTKLMLVSDGAIYTTADSARRKAYTSAMMRQPSANLQQQIAANPGAPLPGDGNPNFLFLAGGIPIRAGAEVVGAIGVGGAASQQDAECAQAGIDKIQSSLR